MKDVLMKVKVVTTEKIRGFYQLLVNHDNEQKERKGGGDH